MFKKHMRPLNGCYYTDRELYAIRTCSVEMYTGEMQKHMRRQEEELQRLKRPLLNRLLGL